MNPCLRAIIAATCAASFLPTAASAQPVEAPTSSPNLSIESQELGAALTQLGRVSGREIVFSTELVRGHRTAGVRSAASVEDALIALLEGTGLVWRASATGAIVVVTDGSNAEISNATLMIQEIVVTAQRREEREQEVPIAVTAFGADAIDAYRLERLRDVSRVTPGLLVSSFSQSSPTIAIRGASNTFTQIGANKPVAVVIDDVFVPRNSAADFDLFGLNSLQILRGPQGTLFGRNVTGGAILIDTGKPEFGDPAAKLRATVGDYSARAGDVLVDVPIGDDAAFRVAGLLREHDGYGRDRLTGREQDDQDSAAIRAQARLRLGSNAELLLAGDYSEDENGGRTLSSLGAGNDGDRRTSETGIAQRFDRRQKGASARIAWNLGGGTLNSITAIRDSTTSELYSNVGASYTFLSGTQSQLVSDDADHVRALSQEIRYASPSWDLGRFLLGAYALDEDSSRLLRSQAFAAGSGATVTSQSADQAVDSRSVAAFADGTVHLPARLDLTLGVRYTRDRKSASLIRTDLIAPRNNFAATGLEQTWDELTPRAVLSWTPLSDLHSYVSYSRGYTAGGFNTEAATLAALTQPFDPETVRNLEVGVKSEWLQDRLRVNVAAFRMDYEDKQELFFNNVTRILTITNAAKATSKGVELEMRLAATRWLMLHASYGLLDTRYDEFIIPGGAVYSGNPLSSSPEDKISFGADLRWPLGSWGELTGTALYSSTSSYFTGASAAADLRVPAYDLVNLSIGVAPLDGPWALTAFVRNLQDTEYLLTPSTQTVRAEYLGEPRTVGLTLTWNF